MTDKRIIDGINVSDCYYYSDTDYDYCYMDSSEFGCAYCYDNSNCYYKQLKRKEQECENLRIKLEYYIEKQKQLLCDVEVKEIYEQALEKVGVLIAEYQGLTLGKPRTMRENDCIYNILDIINSVKENEWT